MSSAAAAAFVILSAVTTAASAAASASALSAAPAPLPPPLNNALAASTVTARASAPLQPPLNTLCSWPYLEQNFVRSARAPTRVAQRLLNAALNASLAPDGGFGAATAAAVSAFQKASGLAPDGALGSETWPLLVAATTPIAAGAAGAAVGAVQDGLCTAGFAVPVSGQFDAATAVALAAFQASRGASVTSGALVDAQTMHLLATGCNATLDTQAFWLDIGWPQGPLSVAALTCVREKGFRFLTQEVWLEESSWFATGAANIANAWAAGFESVGAYVFPVRAHDPAQEAAQILGNLSAAKVRYDNIMIDIEGNDWGGYSQAENRDFISALRAGLEAGGAKLVVYCGLEWPQFFGANFTAFSDLPIVYAHYDNVPSYEDAVDHPYGGWAAPSGKQFWDGAQGETICGLGAVDWDWSAKPFW